jgi:uncharacterized protein (DUF952 family)
VSEENILHIADRAYWESVRATGAPYEMSTRDRTLAQEGFIHCSRNLDQATKVLRRFYADVAPTDLVLLVIDPSRLTAPLRHEPADGDVFPHLYGPLPLSAVIDVQPVPEAGKLPGGGFA